MKQDAAPSPGTEMHAAASLALVTAPERHRDALRRIMVAAGHPNFPWAQRLASPPSQPERAVEYAVHWATHPQHRLRDRLGLDPL